MGKGGTHGGSRLRGGLVATQVGVSFVLLVVAGLLTRSLTSLHDADPGFDPKNVLTGRISMTKAVYENTEERVCHVNQTLDRLKALPGVESAAFVAPMPFSGDNVGSDFRIEGRPKPEPGQEPSANNRSVTPEYFQAIRIHLPIGSSFLK